MIDVWSWEFLWKKIVVWNIPSSWLNIWRQKKRILFACWIRWSDVCRDDRINVHLLSSRRFPLFFSSSPRREDNSNDSSNEPRILSFLFPIVHTIQNSSFEDVALVFLFNHLILITNSVWRELISIALQTFFFPFSIKGQREMIKVWYMIYERN